MQLATATLVIGIVLGVVGSSVFGDRQVRSRTVCDAALLSVAHLEDIVRRQPLSVGDERFAGHLARSQNAADRNCTWLDFPPGASLPTPPKMATTIR